MVNIDRMQVSWSGSVTGPAVSTFYATSGAAALSALANFFAAIKSYVPAITTFDVHNGGDTIDPLTGTLTGTWGVGTTGPITCTGTGSWSRPNGLMMRWETGTILHGHRLRGKTYIVPAVGSVFDNTGAVVAATQTAFNNAATAMITAAGGSLVVWNRPKGSVPGGFSAFTSGTVSPKAAILSSRRD